MDQDAKFKSRALCSKQNGARQGDRIVSATQVVNSKVLGTCIIYTMGWACDSFKVVPCADIKKKEYQNIYETQNVFIFSGHKLLGCAGLNYIADVVSVSDDGT